MPDPESGSRRYWDKAARENAEWYVATDYTDSEAFFSQGAAETDHFLGFLGIGIRETDVVLEIGCGVGRMTRRLSELAGRVVATDVSGEMLARCRRNLDDRANVRFVELPGDGDMGQVGNREIDVVFSYITLQHVPTAAAQLRYLTESVRVLAGGGRMGIQIRGVSLHARALDWAGHLAHLLRGRRTLNSEWRGARLSDDQVLDCLGDSGVAVEVLTFNARHRWVRGVRHLAGEASTF